MSRLLLGYFVVVGTAVALNRTAPAWTTAGTMTACFLVPLAFGGLRTRLSLLQPRWRATLSSTVDGCVTSLAILPAFLGVVYLLGEWRPAPVSAGVLARDVAMGVLAIALPEEFFFRGYLQRELDRLWPRTIRILGAPCGWGLLVAAVLFAFAHVIIQGNPGALLVLFPGLVFGWLYARHRSIAGPVIFHAACNLSLLARPGLM